MICAIVKTLDVIDTWGYTQTRAQMGLTLPLMFTAAVRNVASNQIKTSHALLAQEVGKRRQDVGTVLSPWLHHLEDLANLHEGPEDVRHATPTATHHHAQKLNFS